MFNSYKNRFILLVVVLILFIPITWNLAFKKTIFNYRENCILEEKLKLAENADEAILMLQDQLDQWDKTMVVDTSKGDVQNRLLNDISELCRSKNILLKQLPPVQKTFDNNYIIENINVQVSGTFYQLMQLLYELESPERSFNIVSISFLLNEAKGELPEQLILSIYLQTIKENKE